MRFLAASLLLLASLGAHAQPQAAPRSYAVMSMLADSLTVVSARMRTGSNMDPNHRLFVPLTDPILQNEALISVRREVLELEPQAKLVLLGAKDPGLYEMQKGNNESALLQIAAEAKKSLEPGEATHLILVTKYRQETRLQFVRGKQGEGFLEGLGFYIDRTVFVHDDKREGEARGLMAPFAYFRVSLVDLAAGKVVREEVAAATGPVHSALGVASGDVWDSLSGKDKVEVLRNLIVEEIHRMVPALLKPS